MKNKFVFLSMLIAVILLPVGAHAIPFPFYLTQSNALPDGPVYATVYVDIIGDDIANVVVDVDQSILVPAGNFGIDKFFINTDLQLSKSDFVSGPAWDVKYNKEASEFGKFAIEFKGNGSSRLDPLTFSIHYTGIGLDDFEVNNAGYIFAAHIGGFNYGGQNSAFFANGTTAVPEPATMLLLGTGLIVLAGLRRRFKN